MATAHQKTGNLEGDRRAALLKSIARGRAWLDEIVAGTTTVEQIAARQKCSVHACSAPGTGIFAAETEAENASARSGDLETSSAH